MLVDKLKFFEFRALIEKGMYFLFLYYFILLLFF